MLKRALLILTFACSPPPVVNQMMEEEEEEEMMGTAVAQITRGGVVITTSDALGEVAAGAHMLTYTISNTGTALLTVANVTSAQATNVDVSVAASAMTVAAGASSDVIVTYTPTAPGAFSFQLTVAGITFTVSGTRAADAVMPTFTLTRDDNVVGANEVLETETTYTYTITNTGAAPLHIGSVSASTLDNCTVDIAQPVTTTLAPGAFTTFDVEIFALDVGTFSFSLSITSDAAPVSVAVSGELLGAPALEVTLPFGSYPPRMRLSDDVVIPVIIKNVGTADAHITSVLTANNTGLNAVVRDEPASTIARGDATVAMLRVQVDAVSSSILAFRVNVSGDASGSYDFNSRPRDGNRAVYTQDSANGPRLFSTLVDAVSTIELSPAASAGAGGVSTFLHRNNYTLFIAQTTSGGPSEVYYSALGSAPTTSVSAGLGNASGLTGAGGDDCFYFLASASGATQLYLGNGPVLADAAGPALPTGGHGVQNMKQSSDPARIALLGDFETAGDDALFVGPGQWTKVTDEVPDMNSIHWGGGGQTLTFEVPGTPRSLYYSTGAAAAVKLSGTLDVTDSQFALAGTRVFFRAGGELYVVRIIAGVPQLPAVALNGGTPPGMSGVRGYAISMTASTQCFTPTPANTSRPMLTSLYYVDGLTVTKVVTVPDSRTGVRVDAVRSPVSETRFLYGFDGTTSGRQNLYLLESGVPLAGPLTNAATSGDIDINTGAMQLHADGNTLVYHSSFGQTGTGTGVWRTALTASPVMTRLSSPSQQADIKVMCGDRVFFQCNGGSAPQRLCQNQITGDDTTDSVISGSTITGGNGLFGEVLTLTCDIAFYTEFTNVGLYSGTTAGVATRIDSGGMSTFSPGTRTDDLR